VANEWPYLFKERGSALMKRPVQCLPAAGTDVDPDAKIRREWCIFRQVPVGLVNPRKIKPHKSARRAKFEIIEALRKQATGATGKVSTLDGKFG